MGVSEGRIAEVDLSEGSPSRVRPKVSGKKNKIQIKLMRFDGPQIHATLAPRLSSCAPMK